MKLDFNLKNPSVEGATHHQQNLQPFLTQRRENYHVTNNEMGLVHTRKQIIETGLAHTITNEILMQITQQDSLATKQDLREKSLNEEMSRPI